MDESPTIQVEETQYDENKEAYVKASQPDVKNNESLPAAQKRQTPGQLITPVTPRTRTERAETPTPPLGPAPSLPTQFPDPQSPRKESDDGRSERSDDGPEEGHPNREVAELHTLPKFDWDGLEAEYFAAMDGANEVEAKLSEEFKVLANVRPRHMFTSLCTNLTNPTVLRSMVQRVACKGPGKGCEAVQD